MYVCLCVCPSSITLKWHNIVNFQYIAIQLYRTRRVDIRQRYVGIEIWHSPSTRTTQVATTLAVRQIFEMQYLHNQLSDCFKIWYRGKASEDTNKKCQWLDKHPDCIRDNTICIPQLFEMQYLHE